MAERRRGRPRRGQETKFTPDQVFMLEGLIVGNTYDMMAEELGVSINTVFAALRTWVHERYGETPLYDGIIRLTFEAAQCGFIGRACLPSGVNTGILNNREVLDQCRAFWGTG